MLYQFLLALLLPTHVSTKSFCYSLGGHLMDDRYAPCQPDAEYSACCSLNKELPNVCLSSGLCYWQSSQRRGFIFAEGCTDPQGKVAACPNVCRPKNDSVDQWNILQCTFGTWCCRESTNTTSCCDDPAAAIGIMDVGTMLLSNPVATSRPSGNSTLVTAVTASDSSTSTSTASVPTSSSSSVCEQSRKDIPVVSASISAALGVLLIASAAAIWRMSRRQKGLKRKIEELQAGPTQQGRDAQLPRRPSRPPVEMDGRGLVQEMDGKGFLG